MNIILTILLAVLGLIVLLLIIGLFLRKDHYVKREIIINAPRQKVFDYIRLLENQDKFNKHAMTDRNRQTEITGTDGTVGYIYAWKGNKDAGEGAKEIKKIVEGERIETEIRFVKPMTTTAHIVMETESMPDGQTKVSWSNGGVLSYPVNLFIPLLEKKLPRDMDSSLMNLKKILEAGEARIA